MVVSFLRSPGLNKGQLAEWLGEVEEENASALSVFVSSFNFHCLSFEAALREFLSKIEVLYI